MGTNHTAGRTARGLILGLAALVASLVGSAAADTPHPGRPPVAAAQESEHRC